MSYDRSNEDYEARAACDATAMLPVFQETAPRPSAAQVRDYMEHWLEKLEVIAKGRTCSISCSADNFAGKGKIRAKFSFYIRDSSSGIAEFEAPIALLSAATHCMTADLVEKAADLRRQADELDSQRRRERGEA